MEKRVVVLIVLCVGVFIGWNYIYQKMYPPIPVVVPTGTPAATSTAQPTATATATAQPTPTAVPTPPVQPVVDEQLSTLKNAFLSINLTNKGAGIVSGVLKMGDQKDAELLRPFGEIPYLAIEAINADDKIHTSNWSVKEALGSVTYTYAMRDGIQLEKKFTLVPAQETYSIKWVLGISNTTDKPITHRFRIHVMPGLDHDSEYQYERYAQGVVALKSESGAISVSVITLDAPAAEASKQIEVRDLGRDWFGLRNRYFTALLVPGSTTDVERKWIQAVQYKPTEQDHRGRRLKALSVTATTAEYAIPPASPFRGEFTLFIGPLKEEALKEVPQSSSHFLSYGCWGLFNIVGKLILAMLNFLYSILGNYGWAIIVTTIIIRLILFPLSKKSQVSMMKMTALSPKLNVIKEKYAGNMQKVQQESMRLYKENGVSPLSGCLPVLMQLPIFIGLYSVLDISVDLRQSPFLSWIKDLSQPDRLIPFAKPVSFIFTIDEFNLLPIIMTFTWFLQAYLAPRSTDPQMAMNQKIMMIMPVFFGLMCYSLASGLSLYFFVNSLLAMAEQKLIKKYFLQPGQAPPAVEKPKGL